EKPETAVASADAGGDDAPEVKPAVLRMTPDEAEGDEGDSAPKAAPRGEASKEPGGAGRSKATLAPARP
ncbi:MAG TPA: hypothetical protein VK459_07335, partial [Polyangiaceae bacterium]|nr:hypothetical protein [Polyangiaceae bacterium]